MGDARSTERARLLTAAEAPEEAAPSSPLRPPRRAIWRILLPATTVVFILAAGNQLSLAPSTAILQERVCEAYYHGRPSSRFDPAAGTSSTMASRILDGDDPCKAEPVQSEISFILGWRDVFEELPAIFLTMPFGILSDRIGRRKVMILATLGVVLSDTWIRVVYWFPGLPLRLVWLSGVWQMVGAGAPTLTSVVFAQVADVCPVELRPIAFSFIQAALLVPQILFLPLGSAFISVNPWIPMLGTTVLGSITILIACLTLIETLPALSVRDGTDQERQPLLGQDPEPDRAKSDLRSRLQHTASKARELYQLAANNRGLTCVLLGLFTFNFGLRSDGVLLLLYVSKRLNWPLEAASLLLPLRTIVTLVLLSIILPALSRFLLVRLKVPENRKNKMLMEICGVFFAVGAAFIFLAQSWVSVIIGQFLVSVGSVFLAPARSLLAGLVEQQHTGAVFTLSSVMLHGGSLASAPIMAASFKWGMKLGAFWMGMPFLVAFGCFIVGTMLLLPVSVTERESAEGDALSTTSTADADI